MKKYYALFEYDSFIIRLLPHGYNINTNNQNDNQEGLDMSFMSMSAYVKQNIDSFPLFSLERLTDEIKSDLWHETIHWWQAISTPFIISRHLLSSKVFRANTELFSLKKSLFSDTFFMLHDTDEEQINAHYESTLMNFKHFSMTQIEVEELETIYNSLKNIFAIEERQLVLNKIKEGYEKDSGLDIYRTLYGNNHGLFNVVSDSPPVAMPFFEFPHFTIGQQLPGYSAILDYFYYIDFSGDNIIEAITYINEVLAKNENIPQIDFSDIEDHKYLGIWEFYRRLHSNRYDNEKELALSFLALADLSLTNDPFRYYDERDEYDIDYKFENSSLPYRFGKIVYRAQSIKPLKIINNDYAKSIINHQEELCSEFGMPRPEIGIKRLIAHIMSVIFIDLEKYYEFSSPEQTIQTLLSLYKDPINKWNEIPELLSSLNRANSSLKGKITINHTILGIILNCLFFRLDNRGKIAVPFFYYNEIYDAFPKPLIIFEGNYFMDLSLAEGTPYNISYSAFSLCHDFISLKTSSTVKNKSLTCGFKEGMVKCIYQANGFGCPYKQLKDIERKKREIYSLGDWCHWTHFIKNHQVN